MKLSPEFISVMRGASARVCLMVTPEIDTSSCRIILEPNSIGITLISFSEVKSDELANLMLVFHSDDSTPTGFHSLRLRVEQDSALAEIEQSTIDVPMWVSPKGELDSETIPNGMVVIPAATVEAEEIFSDPTVQTDGKVISASRSKVGLLRFNTTGVLDENFGEGGKIFYKDTAYKPFPTAITVQPDKKIIFSYCNGSGIFVCRFNSNGSWDENFKKLATKITGAEEYIYTIVVQLDGKILLSGCSGEDVWQGDHYVMRLHSNGEPDTEFCHVGRIITPLSYYLYIAHSMAVQPDGKVLLAAVKRGNRNRPKYTFISYNTDGGVDTNGCRQGDFQVPGDIGDFLDGFVLMPDGKMLLVHSVYRRGLDINLALVCYNQDGSLHENFGEKGVVYIPVSLYEEAVKLTLGHDGAIILNGYMSGDKVVLVYR